MGVVYRGEHVDDGHPVAVKLLTSERAQREDFRDAFRVEVQALARLHHRNIASVLDAGRLDARAAELLEVRAQSPWVAMEFVQGERLASPLAGWDETRKTLLKILDALAHAHALGVIHRDLKPANVLAQGDELKIVDFGIALRPDDLTSQLEIESDRVAGTPRYMAPEQVLGSWRDHGPWTDLYAVGCTAWGLVCGQPPFSAETPLETMRKHVELELPPLRPVFDVPDGLDAWLKRLLSKSIYRRYRRAADATWGLLQLSGNAEPGTASRPASSPNSNELNTTIVEPLSRVSPSPYRGALEDDQSDEILSPLANRERARVPPTPPLVSEPPPPSIPSGAGLGLFGLRLVPLVDRKSERAALWESLQSVRRERKKALVLVTGPRGCGKSRLVEWFAQRGHEFGSLEVMVARHAENEDASTGLTGMITRFFQTEAMSWTERFERMRNVLLALGATAPEAVHDANGFAGMSGYGIDGETSSSFGSRSERDAAILRLFRRVAGERAVLFWIDDAHYAGSALETAAHLLEEADDLPLLVVVSYGSASTPEPSQGTESWDRPLEARIRNELTTQLRRSPDHVLELGPLSRESQRTLIQAQLRLADTIVDGVVERTEGNPLFALQLLGDWVDRDVLVPKPGGFRPRSGASLDVPESIHALWRERIDRIIARQTDPVLARESLLTAATLGKNVRFDEWAIAVGHVAKVTHRGPLAAFVETLQFAGLVERDRHGWSFSHNMLRESILRGSGSPDEKSRRHAACADALTELHPNPGRHIRQRVARHLASCGRLADAVFQLERASTEAHDAGENSEALALLKTQLGLLGKLGVAPGDRRVLENYFQRARCLRESGRARKARELIGELRDLAASDAHLVLGRAIGLEAALHRDDGKIEESLKLYDLAWSHLDQSDEDTIVARAFLTASLGGAKWLAGRMTEARDAYRDAVALFVRTGNQHMECTLRHLHAAALLQTGQVDEAHEELARARKLASATGSKRAEAACINLSGDIARAQQHFEDARQLYLRAAELWSLLGNRNVPIAKLNLALVEVQVGRVDRARSLFTEVERSFESIAFGSAIAMPIAGLVYCAAERRDWDEWDRQIARLQERLEEAPLVERDLASLLDRASKSAGTFGEIERQAVASDLAKAQWNRLQNR